VVSTYPNIKTLRVACLIFEDAYHPYNGSLELPNLNHLELRLQLSKNVSSPSIRIDAPMLTVLTVGVELTQGHVVQIGSDGFFDGVCVRGPVLKELRLVAGVKFSWKSVLGFLNGLEMGSGLTVLWMHLPATACKSEELVGFVAEHFGTIRDLSLEFSEKRVWNRIGEVLSSFTQLESLGLPCEAFCVDDIVRWLQGSSLIKIVEIDPATSKEDELNGKHRITKLNGCSEVRNFGRKDIFKIIKNVLEGSTIEKVNSSPTKDFLERLVRFQALYKEVERMPNFRMSEPVLKILEKVIDGGHKRKHPKNFWKKERCFIKGRFNQFMIEDSGDEYDFSAMSGFGSNFLRHLLTPVWKEDTDDLYTLDFSLKKGDGKVTLSDCSDSCLKFLSLLKRGVGVTSIEIDKSATQAKSKEAAKRVLSRFEITEVQFCTEFTKQNPWKIIDTLNEMFEDHKFPSLRNLSFKSLSFRSEVRKCRKALFALFLEASELTSMDSISFSWKGYQEVLKQHLYPTECRRHLDFLEEVAGGHKLPRMKNFNLQLPVLGSNHWELTIILLKFLNRLPSNNVVGITLDQVVPVESIKIQSGHFNYWSTSNFLRWAQLVRHDQLCHLSIFDEHYLSLFKTGEPIGEKIFATSTSNSIGLTWRGTIL